MILTENPKLVTSRPVLAIIGPSASGKSTVVRELHHRGVVRVHPTWTTRPRRVDEGGGTLEHSFVTDAQFDDLRDRGWFWDTVEMFGLPHRYGLPPFVPASDGPVDLVMLRAPLVDRFVAHVPDVVIYQVEADEQWVRRRLAERDVPPDDVAARLRDNQAEVALGRKVAHRRFRNGTTVGVLADAIAGALRVDVAGQQRSLR